MSTTLDRIALPSLAWVHSSAEPAPEGAPTAPGALQRLQCGQSVVLEQPQYPAVICTEGALWITLEGAAPGNPAGAPRLRVQALSDASVQMFSV